MRAKFDIGDMVWFFFTDAEDACSVHLESTKVVSVFPPSINTPVSYILESDNSAYRVPEARVFATRDEARAGAISFVYEQLNNWQAALKKLEDNRTKPKFDLGQTVWYTVTDLVDSIKVKSGTVTHIDPGPVSVFYRLDNGSDFSEERLYGNEDEAYKDAIYWCTSRIKHLEALLLELRLGQR